MFPAVFTEALRIDDVLYLGWSVHRGADRQTNTRTNTRTDRQTDRQTHTVFFALLHNNTEPETEKETFLASSSTFSFPLRFNFLPSSSFELRFCGESVDSSTRTNIQPTAPTTNITGSPFNRKQLQIFSLRYVAK